MHDSRRFRFLTFLGAVMTAAVIIISCGRDTTAPGAHTRFARGLAWNAVFPAAFQQAGGSGSGLVPFTRVHVVLRHHDGTIALDTVVDFPAGADSLPVSLTVPLAADAPAAGEPLSLNLGYVNAAGDTVFRGGPIGITVAPTQPGQSAPPPITIPVQYTGPGATAARVVIAPRSVTVNTGGTFLFTATVLDGSGQTLPGTPIVWTSLDPSRATITAPGAGAGQTQLLRGTAQIVAQLLTGPADTVTVQIQPQPSSLALVSGNSQTAVTGAQLAQPLIVRVTAADGLGVAGVPVTFAIASGGGSVGTATATTDASGLAQTTWRLGNAIGAQSVTATAAGLTGSPVTFTATAQQPPATKLAVTTAPTTTTAGQLFGVTITAQDAQNGTATSFTGPVTLALANNPSGDVLSGTLTANAVNGVATFAGLSLAKTATGVTITATASGLTSATTAPFNVTAGAATRFIFVTQPPPSSPAGQSLGTITVEVRDAANNVVTAFNGAMTMSLLVNPTNATLGGTTTVTATNGVATFTGLTIPRPGTGYVLSAAVAGLGSGASNEFNIVPAPAANLTLVSGAGQAGAPNTTLPLPVIVRVTDALGNNVSGQIITFAVATGGGSVGRPTPTTDTSGTASTTWTLGPLTGTQTITATATGLTGSPITVSATANIGAGTVASTTVAPHLDTLTALGDVFTLTAQARNASNAIVTGAFTWVSRTPGVASVNSSGVVTAVTNGTTWVAATEVGGTRDSALIVVQQRIASIAVTPGARNIYLGGTFPFSASAVDGRGNALASQPAITWSSLTPSVASVTAAGVATGVTLGSTQVRATAGAIVGVATLNVLTPITRIVVMRDSAGFVNIDTFTVTALGRTRSYRAVAHDTLDAPMTGVTFAWTSTNGSVAVIDSSGPTTARARAAANGLTAITASAQGVNGSALLTVSQVLAAITLTPSTASIAPTGTVAIVARGKDANNQFISGGTFTFASSAASIATVNAATGVVTGVANGTAKITASSGAIVSDTATITVGGAVPAIISFSRDTLSVGRGGSISVPILLSKPNATAITVTLAVADTFAFWSTTSVTIPANQTSINATLNGHNAGTTKIYAVDGGGAGYAGDTAVLAVQATMHLTNGGYGLNVTDQLSTQVLLSDPSPAGGTYITFSYTTAGIASVSPDPAFIPAGQLAADIVIRGIGAGSTNIIPVATGVNGTASSFNATAPLLHVSTTSFLLGRGQYEPNTYVYLPQNTNVAVPLTFTSTDTNVVTVTPNSTIPSGSYYSYFPIVTKNAGTARVRVTSPGWASDSVRITVTSPAVGICCGTTLNTTSPASNMTVYAEDSVRTAHNRTSSLVVRLRSSDTTVMKVLDTVVTIGANTYYNNSGRVIPGGAGGSAWIYATASGHITDSTQFTVVGPKLQFSWFSNQIGAGQEDDNVYVYAPNNVTTPLTVTITNTDSTKLAAPVTVTIPVGLYYAYFNVRGKAPGAVTLYATAVGYSPDTASYLVTSPRIVSSGGTTLNNFGPARAFTIYATDSVGSSHIRTAALAVHFTSTNPAVATVDTGVTIAAGSYYNSTAAVTPVGVGTTQIIATAPGHRPDTTTWTVQTPKLNFSFFSYVIGNRQHRAATDFYVYTPDNRTSPLTVTLTQKHATIDSLSSTTLTVPNALYYSYFTFFGKSRGVDTVIASAPGYLPDTAFITVTSQKFVASGLPGTANTTDAPYGVTVYATDSVGNAHYASDTIVVHAVSSDTTVIRPTQAYFRILKDQYFASTSITYVGPGNATITYADSAGTGYGSVTTNAVTVTGPALRISGSSAVLGMRQQTGATDYYVYTPNNVGTPLVVHLLSTGTRVVTVPDSIIVPAGLYYAYFPIVAKDTLGTIQIQATATGYTATSMTVQVTAPKFVVSTSGSVNTTSPRQSITIYATDANGNAHYATENVTITLAAASPSVATIDSTTVTIPAGQYYTNLAGWRPGTAGTTQLSATDTRAAFYKYGTGTANVQVLTPTLSLSWNSFPLGLGQYQDMYVSTPDNQTSALTVNLSHIGTARTTIPSSTSIPAATYYSYFRIAGTLAGTDSILAAAAGHNARAAEVVVALGRINPLSGWPSSLAVGDSALITLYARDQATGVHYVTAATTFTLTPNAFIKFVSGGAGSATITSVTIPADQQYVQFYIKGVSSGTGSASITNANYQSYSNTVTVP